jgi:hypothetical protein
MRMVVCCLQCRYKRLRIPELGRHPFGRRGAHPTNPDDSEAAPSTSVMLYLGALQPPHTFRIQNISILELRGSILHFLARVILLTLLTLLILLTLLTLLIILTLLNLLNPVI